MELLTPGVGLIFWQVVVFVILLVFLKKFAWQPILNALKIREESIEEALATAEEARKEIEGLKADNENLLDEARREREIMLKEARDAASAINKDARDEASKVSIKMIEDAKAAIESEKQVALTEVRNQVSELSLAITEKILKERLASNKAQTELIEKYVKDLKLN